MSEIDRAELRRLLEVAEAATERVRELHAPTDVDVLQSACAAEDCEHEFDCPTIEMTVCKSCYHLGESIDIYSYERGGIEHVSYPCPTIQALDGGGIAVLPDLLAQAWDEGHAAGCTDPYKRYGECGCGPNPHRQEC